MPGKRRGKPELTRVGDEPQWPTRLRSRLRDGRLQGTDRSLWLYRMVPLSPVVDARTPAEALTAAEPLMAMFEELSDATNITVKRRALAKGSYRQVHMLLVNVPTWYQPPRDHPLRDYLSTNHGRDRVDRRLLLFGVRLQDKVSSGGLRDAVDSVVETIVAGSVPLSDYDEDTEKMNAAMDRAGLVPISAEDVRLANAWWNHGDNADTPMIVHPDHIHVFNSVDSVQMAERAGVDHCSAWNTPGGPVVGGTHSLTFASVQDIDLNFMAADAPAAAWVSDMVEHDALAVSIRGNVEPGTVTREELRRQRKRFVDDINERTKQGKMERAEQVEMLEMLASVEGLYASVQGTPPPTLASASVVAAFNGQYRDSTQILPMGVPAKLSIMDFRQNGALEETWLCSSARANPNLHDLPAQTVACSGIISLSFVGDEEGALVGFTERDNQPAYISPKAASATDASPILVTPGQTGSGKRLALSTRIPTPSGWTTMGTLKVGDRVLSGGGKPCVVTFLSEVCGSPDLYRLTFDDGTSVVADREHQWLVTDARMRGLMSQRRMGHVSAVAEKRRESQYLLAACEAFGDDHDSTIQGLFEIVVEVMPNPRWNTWFGVRTALDFVDAPYSLKSAIEVGRSGGRATRVYNTRVALKSLALRIEQSHHGNALAERGEFRITTGEMIDAGIYARTGANFAIRLTGVDLPEAELLVDPYVLGAWLGDGSKDRGNIASARVASTSGEDGYTDQDHMLARLREVGYEVQPLGSNPDYVVAAKGLAPHLRAIGVLNDKHVPDAYMRASFEQRLALVQGLMDTDGCVTKEGICAFTQKDDRLFWQFVELARSLGIKVNVRNGIPLSYGKKDGSGERVSTGATNQATFRTDIPVASIPRKASRIRTKVSPRASHKYVVSIDPVKPGDSDYEAARCITVDSPDHTYLCDQFTINLNTMLMLSMADQFARAGRPVVIFDPKQESDHSAVVLNGGGQVYSLDRLIDADGVFDPIRFSSTPEVGVELASSMLMSINPWGPRKEEFEVPLQHALSYGVNVGGATCIGQALAYARDNLSEREVDPFMVDRVTQLADASPQFRSICGVSPRGDSLKAAQGMTLIKVGSAYLDLPQPGQPPTSVPQRIALALVRMVVFGSAMAVAGRDGVVMLDEAWIVLGAGAAEVERLGRLARSQQVLPMLFTQRVTDALNAGLAGYISRGLILPMEDPAEAAAACELFKLEPTPNRMARLTAKATIGGSSNVSVAPNWASMRALRHPETGKVIRGAIAIYSDLSGRAIPVEIKLSEDFLHLASTNPEDIRRRRDLQALRLEEPASTEASQLIEQTF